jgi:hypothetical protein
MSIHMVAGNYTLVEAVAIDCERSHNLSEIAIGCVPDSWAPAPAAQPQLCAPGRRYRPDRGRSRLGVKNGININSFA